MRAYVVTSDRGIDAIEIQERPAPTPAAGQVLVELRAASLNFRALMGAEGGYPASALRPVVALSDGACEVGAVGEGVTRWRSGDRVVAAFLEDWLRGPFRADLPHSARGGGIDGVLQERFLAGEGALLAIPEHLSFAEAATLPCAAVTAWNALTAAGTKVGDRVLVLGTGGVSIFAIQLARLMGAKPIVTSSDDAKLRRARELGAVAGINYRAVPDWHERVLELTDGEGVEHVIETGGPGTLERSLSAAAFGGVVSLIGVLAQGEPPPMTTALMKALTVRGIYVGSAEMFASLNRAITAHQLRPVIHQRFGFDDVLAAYRARETQEHVGKIVVERG